MVFPFRKIELKDGLLLLHAHGDEYTGDLIGITIVKHVLDLESLLVIIMIWTVRS